MDGHPFAVVDVETTGLFAKIDRVIEIAIVEVDPQGRISDEYTTLVNPDRDIGPTDLHGITAGDVLSAPRFREIIGDILERLAGRIFVAHNVSFDVRFITTEMSRNGCDLPRFPVACTMKLARRVDPDIPGRKLKVLCDYFDIEIGSAHSALDDARAEARLLTHCLDRLDDPTDPQAVGLQGPLLRAQDWPSRQPSGKVLRRDQATDARGITPGYIPQLVSRLPASAAGDAEIEQYLLVLDRVLEDRRITSEEADELLALAHDLGVFRDQALAAHLQYMKDLFVVALEDGVITESERRDLYEVQRLLNIPDADAERIEQDSRQEFAAGSVDRSKPSQVEVTGKSVCFTGAMRCTVDGEKVTRERAHLVAEKNGMEVRGSVAKDLDFLVVADPDSMSGKAKKARKYGVRILAEPVFWRMMGVEVV